MPTRYEGAIDWPEPSADDPREKIDKACHPKCASAWDTYLKCGERIEAKGSGDCSSWYMDYLRCVDQCAVKTLFTQIN